MTKDFNYDEIEEDVDQFNKKKKEVYEDSEEKPKWNKGYLPPAEKGPGWYCDCEEGNGWTVQRPEDKRMGYINGDYRYHKHGCTLRKRLASREYMAPTHGVTGQRMDWY